MTPEKALLLTVTIVYFTGLLGFAMGLTSADKHNDRPLVVTLLLAVLWPILTTALAGIAVHRMITGENYFQPDADNQR